MPETTQQHKIKQIFRHRGRLQQIPIYLGKQLRGFVYQTDWKVLPMAAIIAVLVSMVVKNSFFVTREGTLTGSFALCCVGIWNGCFNSIQVICRERGIVKREHRSGMHISSYIAAHMIYQALLCLAQSCLTMYVFRVAGVKIPVARPFITPYLIVDLGITLFLVSYASDMLSLFISALVHNTTAAMTVMPFILIFQLVFSGGIFSLPSWGRTVSNFTISNYGLRCIAAQADYNSMPLASSWNTITVLKYQKVDEAITVRQVLDVLTNDSNPVIKGFRDKKIDASTIFEISTGFLKEAYPEIELPPVEKETAEFTYGDLIDVIANNPVVQERADQKIPLSFQIKDLFDLFGEENVKQAIQEKTSSASYKADFERTKDNVQYCWSQLLLLALVFTLLSIIVLEFIDKDKR